MRAESERLRRKAAAILEREIPRAVKAGMPVAELAHLSRRAVYNILKRR